MHPASLFPIQQGLKKPTGAEGGSELGDEAVVKAY